MSKKPNFFIVGAPKCGTTALSKYLKEHPNVFMSTPKEPHYFASDMTNQGKTNNIKDYLNLFKQTTAKHLAIGEASVWYLYSKKAIRNIFEFDKKAKIIIMLRKPVDMVYSMHSQHLYNGGENEFDFGKAWNLETVRKQGISLPKNILHVPNLFYSEIANYYTQLLNVYSYFPKNQVKIILFDDFKNDTKLIFDDVVEFLNLPLFEKVIFPKVNINKTVKYKIINNLFSYEPNFIKKNRLILKRVLGIENVEFGAKIRKFNSVNKKRKSMSTQVRKLVIKNYKTEVNNLSSLLHKDLSNWNQ